LSRIAQPVLPEVVRLLRARQHRLPGELVDVRVRGDSRVVAAAREERLLALGQCGSYERALTDPRGKPTFFAQQGKRLHHGLALDRELLGDRARGRKARAGRHLPRLDGPADSVRDLQVERSSRSSIERDVEYRRHFSIALLGNAPWIGRIGPAMDPIDGPLWAICGRFCGFMNPNHRVIRNWTIELDSTMDPVVQCFFVRPLPPRLPTGTRC